MPWFTSPFLLNLMRSVMNLSVEWKVTEAVDITAVSPQQLQIPQSSQTTSFLSDINLTASPQQVAPLLNGGAYLCKSGEITAFKPPKGNTPCPQRQENSYLVFLMSRGMKAMKCRTEIRWNLDSGLNDSIRLDFFSVRFSRLWWWKEQTEDISDWFNKMWRFLSSPRA